MGLESNLGSNNAYIFPSSTTFNKLINLSLSQFSYCKMGCMHAKSLQSHLFATLWAIARPPGSSVRGILQARILEWVAISSSRGSSPPRDQTRVSYISCTDREVLTTSATWKAPK